MIHQAHTDLYTAEYLAYREYNTPPMKLAACQAWVDLFTSHPGVIADFGWKTVTVGHLGSKKMLGTSIQRPPTIEVQGEGCRFHTLVHELAHQYDERDWTEVDPHDAEFPARHLRLAHHLFGPKFEDQLRALYVQHDITVADLF